MVNLVQHIRNIRSQRGRLFDPTIMGGVFQEQFPPFYYLYFTNRVFSSSCLQSMIIVFLIIRTNMTIMMMRITER